jgi:hypothetical protein
MGLEWHCGMTRGTGGVRDDSNVGQRTLKFINGDAASIHGSLKVGSVYTSESGEWKLGGFEVLTSVKEDESIIYVSLGYRKDARTLLT